MGLPFMFASQANKMEVTFDSLFKQALEPILKEVTELKGIILANKPGALHSTSEDRTVTTEELCKYLRITEQTAITWRKKGKIPFMKIGTAVRYNLPEVLNALSQKGKK
jgi:excisionase family DNA binding protein